MVAIPASATIKSFWMDTTEVTAGQFKKFLELSGYKPAERIYWDDVTAYSSTDRYPMIYVSRHDATAYAKNGREKDFRQRENGDGPLGEA